MASTRDGIANRIFLQRGYKSGASCTDCAAVRLGLRQAAFARQFDARFLSKAKEQRHREPEGSPQPGCERSNTILIQSRRRS